MTILGRSKKSQKRGRFWPPFGSFWSFLTLFWPLFGTSRLFSRGFLENSDFRVQKWPHFLTRVSKSAKMALFEKSGFWVIFGIFCIFWHVGVHFPNNFGVQFSTFSKIAILAKIAKNGRFLGWVRGPPYPPTPKNRDFDHFLTTFWPPFFDSFCRFSALNASRNQK